MSAHHHRARQRLDAVAARYRPVWDAMEAARRDASNWSPHVFGALAAASRRGLGT